jgi:hypothetical protein
MKRNIGGQWTFTVDAIDVEIVGNTFAFRLCKTGQVNGATTRAESAPCSGEDD